MNKKLYITLLEEEVERLRDQNRQLNYDLNESTMTPLDRQMREVTRQMERDIYAPPSGLEALLKDSQLEEGMTTPPVSQPANPDAQNP